jgi:hypothetical protein
MSEPCIDTTAARAREPHVPSFWERAGVRVAAVQSTFTAMGARGARRRTKSHDVNEFDLVSSNAHVFRYERARYETRNRVTRRAWSEFVPLGNFLVIRWPTDRSS